MDYSGRITTNRVIIKQLESKFTNFFVTNVLSYVLT